MTNGGPLQSVLESKLASLTNSQRRVIPAASGTAALHAVCAAWSLKHGKTLRWATQAFTFPSAMQGPLADAIVIDNDWSLGGPCLSKLSERSLEFDGVVVTNLFGMLTDMASYVQWCQENSKLLIFDNAATAIGVAHGKCIHDMGDGAIISLHETKPVGRGEGGAIFVDTSMHDFVNRAMNFGFSSLGAYGVCRVGHRYCSNWRMSDIAAASATAYIDRIVKYDLVGKINDLICHGVNELNKYPGLALLPGLRFPDPAMPPCICLTLPRHVNVESLIARLAAQERPIEAKQYYRPLCDGAEAPQAWAVFNSCICLPIHVDMHPADVAGMLQTVASEVACSNEV